jgi:uncharacterized protein YndB with AHSA1/START domain
MPDSLHEISIDASPAAVFEAWTTADGLSSWWTKQVRVSPEVGGINVLLFEGARVAFHFRIDDQDPAKLVRWTGVPGQKMPDEWVDTRIEVDLVATNGGTRMRFGHRNWKSAEGAYRVCNTTWGELMYRLRDHCEGRGRGPLFSG